MLLKGLIGVKDKSLPQKETNMSSEASDQEEPVNEVGQQNQNASNEN